MHSSPVSGPRRLVGNIGSLWFGSVLLILLLVAMACATVFESTHGTPAALATFYKSWWFELLLALVGVNIFAAMVVRFPFTKHQVGFVVTHVGILLIFLGAYMTKVFGIDGQLPIYEGETRAEFTLSGQETLVVSNASQQAPSLVDLDPNVFGGLVAVDAPSATMPAMDNVKLEIERYVPDSTLTRRMRNDAPAARAAVEVSLSSTGQSEPVWVMPHRPVKVNSIPVSFRLIRNPEELAELLGVTATEQSADKGTVKITHKSSTYTLAIEACMEKALPIGDTEYTIKVLRYLPHATVGPDNQLTSLSDQPVNPAIEVELSGPDGSEKRLAFAKFPDFSSMHGGGKIANLDVVFVSAPSETAAPTTPIEVLQGPDGDLHVRFQQRGSGVASQEIKVGEPVDTPWPGRSFTVLRKFDHARIEDVVEPILEPREERTAALLLKLTSSESTTTVWLQKYQPKSVKIDGNLFEFIYRPKTLPLGFSLTLDRFRVGYYPGEQRPRSFESQVTLTDAASGLEQSRMISMNNPTKYGGYSLFQSSYRLGASKPMSIFSVSRDPGQLIVFIGYIATMAGMLLVLGTRTHGNRGATEAAATGERRGQSGRLMSDVLKSPQKRTHQAAAAENASREVAAPTSLPVNPK